MYLCATASVIIEGDDPNAYIWQTNTYSLLYGYKGARTQTHTPLNFLKISPPPSRYRYLSNTYTPTHIPLTHPGFSHNVLKPIIAYTLSTERVSSAHWHMTPRTDRSHPAVCTEGFVCTVSTYCKCAELVCLCVCLSVCVCLCGPQNCLCALCFLYLNVLVLCSLWVGSPIL